MNVTAARARTVDFDVEGMTCGSCAARIQRVVGRHDGVASAEVNFATARARVSLDPERVDVADLRAAVERIGYGLQPVGEREPDPGADPEA
ncbi:MAG: heavy-metal-associated domain-containing protein, partial [Actinomycetota bacterium]|nr:heavy-metal-associated domain-containing protein [Actinomycetota bacterium]